MLGVPNNGAFGSPTPQPRQQGTAAMRPPRPPTLAPMGMNRQAPGVNQTMGRVRPDRSAATMHGPYAVPPMNRRPSLPGLPATQAPAPGNRWQQMMAARDLWLQLRGMF